MSDRDKLGLFNRFRCLVGGGFNRLVPYLGVGSAASFVTLRIFAPDHPLGQLVMVGEICLSIGLVLGYLAASQISEEVTE